MSNKLIHIDIFKNGGVSVRELRLAKSPSPSGLPYPIEIDVAIFECEGDSEDYLVKSIRVDETARGSKITLPEKYAFTELTKYLIMSAVHQYHAGYLTSMMDGSNAIHRRKTGEL